MDGYLWQIGKTLLVAGGALVLTGLFLMLWQKLPMPGKLPGDLHLEGKRWAFYLPLTTCLLLSVLLTLLANVILRFFARR